MKIAVIALGAWSWSVVAHADVLRTQCEANPSNEPSYRYEVTLDTKNGVGLLWVFGNGIHDGYLATLRIRGVQTGSALTHITYQNLNAQSTVQDIYIRSDGRGDSSNQREYVVSHRVSPNYAAEQFYNPTGPGTSNDAIRNWMKGRSGENGPPDEPKRTGQTAEEARSAGAVVDNCGVGE